MLTATHTVTRSGVRSLQLGGEIPEAMRQHYAVSRSRSTGALSLPATPYAARVVEVMGERSRGARMCSETAALARSWADGKAFLESLRSPAPVEPPAIPTDDMGRPHWQHQRAAYWLARKLHGCLLHYGMGTGKTRIALDVIEGVGAQKTLVLAPKSVITDAWAHEPARWKPGIASLALGSGPMVRRRNQAERLLASESGQVVIAMNWAAMTSSILDWILETPWDLVVADEIQAIKAPGSKTGRAMGRLARRVPRRLGLSGTPTPQGPHEAYGVFRFIDPALFGSSHQRFKSRYCVMGGYEGREIMGIQNSDELGTLYYLVTHRVGREVLDLPDAHHITRSLELPPSAARVYRDLAEEMIAEIEGGEVTAQNALSKSAKLRQVASGHLCDDDGDWHSVHSAKESALADLLSELPPGEPVVVFAVFRKDLEAIHRVVKASGRESLELSGSRNELEAWQSGKAEVLAVQIQAGGTGTNLVRASTCVYYSQSWSLGQYEQSLARTHRPGQTAEKCLFVHLVVSGTIEPQIYKTHAARREVLDDVLADPRAAIYGQ